MLEVLTFIKKYYGIILLVLLGLFVLLSVTLFKENRRLTEDNDRLSNNQIALTADLEEFKTKSGKSAARVIQLEMTVDELKKTCSDQIDVIKDLNLKCKRLESISTTGSATHAGGKTTLKDTVIVQKTDSIYIESKAQTFKWSDKWNSIEGVIKGKEVDCYYTGVDTLNVVVTRVPKKFLFFRWGTKYFEVNVVNSNPSSHITYNRTIKVKR